MHRTVTVDVAEVQRVHALLEEMNQFFHNPTHYVDVEKFGAANYPEIRALYYDVVRNWLPEDIQRENESR